MAKKNRNADHVKQVRDTLDSLINDEEIPLGETDKLPNINKTTIHNYAEIKNEAKGKAEKTLNKMLKFYLSENIIESEEYITANLKLKYMELSQLIFLMETGERAITTLLTQIDSGELSPRMFEVLATLQKSQLDMIKSQTLYMMAAEESTKKLSRDLQVYNDNSNTKKLKSNNKQNNLSRGTKNIMLEIQEEMHNDIEEIEDTEYSEKNEN